MSEPTSNAILYHRKGTFTAEQYTGPESIMATDKRRAKLPRGVRWSPCWGDPGVLVPTVKVNNYREQVWAGWWILRDIKTGKYDVATPKGFAAKFEPIGQDAVGELEPTP